MANNKFDKLIEIQEDLQKKIQYLTEKEASSLIEWDIALEKTRLLYETLTDIKLAVLSKSSLQEEILEKPKEEVQTEKELPKEEVQKEAPVEEEPVEIEEELIEEEVLEEEQVEEEQAVVVENSQKETPTTNVQDENEEAVKSLNDILVDIQNNMDLATKLQNLPIKTLEEAISLNDKIWFVRELFGGDNDLYNSVIQDINKSDSIKEAIKIVRSLSWDKEDAATKAFFELIYRKFVL